MGILIPFPYNGYLPVRKILFQGTLQFVDFYSRTDQNDQDVEVWFPQEIAVNETRRMVLGCSE